MPYWTYLLHCADGTYYVGHTDDLEQRVGQHQTGALRGYTSGRLPVALVWSQEFGSRHEAKEAEQQLKGWGQAKKRALILGDWAAISILAKKRGASSQRGRSLLFLHPHSDSLPAQPCNLEAAVAIRGEMLDLRFRLTGDLSTVVLPTQIHGARRDELWKTTCFEAFVAFGDQQAYREFNISPSTDWAIYDFASHRSGMIDADAKPERVRVSCKPYEFRLEAVLPLPPAATCIAIAAVIEETNGTKSYWALRHPPGKPDFHHEDGFVLEIPAKTD